MNVTGLTIALAAAVLVGIVFGVYPDLDLMISRVPFEVTVDGYPFALRLSSTLQLLQQRATWFVWLLVAAPMIALLVKLVRPRLNVLIPSRAIVFTFWVLVLAPGLLTNVVLKEHWHRPRPISVTEFGGDLTFVPWWSPAGHCDHNCSFVSGDVSRAAWTLAVAAVVPPAWRAVAYSGALAFTVLIALIRMAFGAHFFSDVVFATIFTFLIAWLLHGLIYRWPRTRLTDDDIDRGWERLRQRFCLIVRLRFAARPRH